MICATAPGNFYSLVKWRETEKCHVWRHKNTSKMEGWEEKWEIKLPKKQVDFYDVTRNILGFLVKWNTSMDKKSSCL